MIHGFDGEVGVPAGAATIGVREIAKLYACHVSLLHKPFVRIREVAAFKGRG
jgi:hypothetical protein